MADQAPTDKVVHIFPTVEVDAHADPWELLHSGRGIAVEELSRVASRKGTVYPATSSFARGLQPVLDLAESTGGKLFRVELPTGSTIDQLVPALGGGYRGMVRGAGKGISGHARLVPVGMTTAKAAKMGVLAVAVAADYLAQQELNAKLDSIQRGVDHLVERSYADDRALLSVAAATIVEAQAAIVGEHAPSVSLGLDSTASDLRRFVEREREWAQGLARAAAKIDQLGKEGKLETDGVPVDLFEQLIGVEDLKATPWRFAEKVTNYYRALVLDSHLAVLATAEATLGSGRGDLTEFQRVLERRLRVNAIRQEELAAATEAIARESITAKVFQRKMKEAHAVERVVRDVAFGIRTSPRISDVVLGSGRQEMVIEVLKSGDVRLLDPK
ncbi:hypothetical protein ACTHQ1_04305 [Janibacter anophelis]|uniref:hypothetical protein n=1 Tax=Janibacter anophelis TaxID=319054 RepID=UPI003F7DBB13